MSNISIGLLDFGIREAGMNSVRIQTSIFEYAEHADTLGFSRFWLAEHYTANKRLAWTNPEPLIPIIAGMTTQIKVGAAGMLLSIHQPFHVAGYFKILNNLFPNRIDLGVANGIVNPVTGRNTVGVEDLDQLRQSFDGNLRQLLNCLRNEDSFLAEEENGVVFPPYKGLIPEVWSLACSEQSLKRALELKLNYSRSLFHQNSDLHINKDLLDAFRENYYDRHGCKPQVNISISGCCQTTRQQAGAIADSLKLSSLFLICSVDELYDKLMEYQYRYGIDEFIFKDVSPKPSDRLRTLELISEKFNLHSDKLVLT